MIIRQVMFVLLFIAALLVGNGHSLDTSTQSPVQVVTKTINQGKAIILQCTVSNSHASDVSWEFLTHNFTIYQGGILMTDNPTKYSIIRPPDSLAYNLQILEVEKSDQGFYQCRDQKTGQSNTFQLDVLEKNNFPVVTKPAKLNRTECCVAANISESCHPACVPSTITDDFDPLFDCGADGTEGLQRLTHCLTAGSNHENCCLFRDIDPICVPFCRNEMPKDLSLEHAACLDQPNFAIFATCATEGFATLPNEPQNVSVIAHNTGDVNYIQVSWKPPSRNADKVTGYKVMYKRSDQDKYFSKLLDDPTTRYVRLSGLNIIPNRGYNVHVAALAEHGSSGASVEIAIFIQDATINDKQNQNIDACCVDRRVSDRCRQRLCQSKTWSTLNVDFLSECYDSLDDVFTCLVGEQDHTSCCRAFDVVPECLAICSGHPPPFNNSLIVCAQQLSIIEACVQQGHGSLPAPPSHLELKSVSYNEAKLTFQPSPSTGLKRIVILLKTGEDKEAKYVQKGILEPIDQAFALSDLTADTYYAVRLTSETDQYGSLPSETVHFLTNRAPVSTQAPITNVAHNFTDCCVKRGMPLVCAIGCKYVQNISSHYAEHLQDCYSHIGTVLSCGADGRDHAECCKRRNVTDPDCLDLCGIAKDGPLDDDYIKCLKDTPKAVACFEEGIVTLPRYPDAVVSRVSQHTISLMWEHPKTSSKIDTYIVHYRQVGKKPFIEELTDKLEFIIHNLLPATEYEITIQSQNDQGISSPSPSIKQFTAESNITKPNFNRTEVSGRQYWANITECCKSSGIPDECVDQCLNKQTSSLDTNNCIFHSHKMLACYADGQDHGECCRESPGLPPTCVAICSGHTMDLKVDTAVCMGHGYKDIIFSCYMKNSGLIPDTPMKMSVTLKEMMKVRVVWEKPTAYCGADCQSIIHYWREDPSDPGVRLNVKSKAGVTSPYDVSVNGPEGFYTFTVTARNTYGSSPPSAKRTLFVSPFNKNVKVTMKSNLPFVESGWNVILQCAVTDFNPLDPYTIKWLLNDRIEKSTTSNDGHQLFLENITQTNDAGKYSCVVKDSTIQVKDSLFLPIKYAPEYFDNKYETGYPGVGNLVKEACLFKGYPDSGAERWNKDGKRIDFSSNKYSASLDPSYISGITTYHLQILDLVKEDYGKYSIDVYNKFGQTSCSFELKDPRDLPNILPAPKVPDPKACCADAGISELCQELCSFDIDVAEIVADPKYMTCLTVFDSLIKCGADGKDHRQCCQEKGVKPYCRPFCLGQSPGSHITDQIQLLECVSEAKEIFSCMESGQKLVPYPPLNVEAIWWAAATSIQVRWSRPKFNHDLVQSYIVYYKSSSIPMEMHHGVNEHTLQYIIPDPKQSDGYEISVVAKNQYGSSQRSNIATVQPLSLSPPTNIRYKVNGISVTITWTPPTGADPNVKYIVHYKRSIESRYLKTLDVSGTLYVLSRLEPRTEYSAYVTSLSDKSYQSSPSKYIRFKTGDIGQPSPDSKGNKGDDDDDGGDKVAIAVGVIVAILAAVAIGVIVYVVLKGRGAFKSTNDTVAFENPMAGNPGGVKIHGVSGSGDEQFNYGRLDEEPVYDNETANGASSSPVAVSFDGAYENPTYAGQESETAGQESEGTQNGAATLQVSSNA